MSNKSVVLISRLPEHGASLNKLLSRYCNVFWVGRTFPFKITPLSAFYVLSLEFWKLLANFKKLRFSLIVVQFVSLDGLVAIFFKRVFRIKIVLFAVGSDVLKVGDYAFAFPIIRSIIARSDFVLCASGSIEKKLREMGLAVSKTKVVPFIFDFDDFEPYNGSQVYDVVTVGKLDSNKNQILLVKACELLASAKALIIGDGPMRKVLESENIKKNLNIVFLGKIPHKQVFTELQKSRIYVHTSKSEGLPIAVLEAISLDLPVILVESPYVRDIIDRYGLLVHVANNSVEDLADKIEYVSRNYAIERHNSMSNKQIVANLTTESFANIENVLDQVDAKE